MLLLHRGLVNLSMLWRRLMADGRLLSWSKDETLRQWDAQTGTQIGPAMRHDDLVRGALVISDGRLLSWSDDTLRQWDANWPAGSIFEIACAILPELEMNDVLDRYQMEKSAPICRPRSIPMPEWTKIVRVGD
jgi:hypothetical protein